MGKLFSIFSKKTKELTCNEEVGILDIRNNYIYTRDGNVIAGLKIYSINTQLLTEREKQNLINELYPDGIDATTLNDILWFDSDWILESLGVKEEEE